MVQKFDFKEGYNERGFYMSKFEFRKRYAKSDLQYPYKQIISTPDEYIEI